MIPGMIPGMIPRRYRGGEEETPVTTVCSRKPLSDELLRVDLGSESDR